MAKKRKYYVVWSGYDPGIYDSWSDCQAQIKGYPNAKYKSFKTREEAENAFENSSDHLQVKKPPKQVLFDNPKINFNSISVDAACSGNPGVMEYRGVDTKTRLEFFKMGPFKNGTNNIGEFLAIVHALALLKKKDDNSTAIYTDSRTALSWIRKKKVNTKLKITTSNQSLFNLIRRAEIWLRKHEYATQILKWNTAEWGEIPADFGRK